MTSPNQASFAHLTRIEGIRLFWGLNQTISTSYQDYAATERNTYI